ncbi:MAG: hypothetical protein EBX37_19105, partial [Alphaproteobacteria bacterium]|nr:hypothetical protein [Alphaproteobacteria bacterium]
MTSRCTNLIFAIHHVITTPQVHPTKTNVDIINYLLFHYQVVTKNWNTHDIISLFGMVTDNDTFRCLYNYFNHYMSMFSMNPMEHIVVHSKNLLAVQLLIQQYNYQPKNMLYDIVKSNNLVMLQWLVKQYNINPELLLTKRLLACQYADKELFKFIHSFRLLGVDSVYLIIELIKEAIKYNNQSCLDYLISEHRHETITKMFDLFTFAVGFYSVETVRKLINLVPVGSFSYAALYKAIEYVLRLNDSQQITPMVQYLLSDECTSKFFGLDQMCYESLVKACCSYSLYKYRHYPECLKSILGM